MPRSRQPLLDHADTLADRLASGDIGPTGPGRDATELRAIAEAVIASAEAEDAVTNAVVAARRASHSWASIALMLGVTTQSAQARYAPLTNT